MFTTQYPGLHNSVLLVYSICISIAISFEKTVTQ